ncbi:MAG: DegV family protein [candidate division WOR-3 bacterium]|nr:DegV family protein [candidate division WOR-3 bacterium]
MVKIVTDDASSIPESLIKKCNITILEHPKYFGDEEVTGIGVDKFYKRLKRGEMPRSALIPTSQLVNVYNKLGEAPDVNAILSLHVSSKLSGTYNSALIAEEMVKDKIMVQVFDTGLPAIGEGMIVYEAAIESLEGKEFRSVVRKTEEAKTRTKVIFGIPNLSFLRRSGRLGKGKALLGAMMRIIPMVTFADGEVVPFGRVRTESQAISKIKGEIRKDLIEYKAERLKVFLGYTTDKETCLTLEKAIREEFPVDELHVFQMSIEVGVIVGPDVWGISYYPMGG